eukprot:CAMPEP_0178736760 /NCGR_PEP_ID=MMETSP0744-20121128/2614_1 /TAXON_ID=913974 /ORGANISM="Nitzschia punctata, Strain CCMP561" /LENGTH=627 /DNA_ID=CAMNT_0020389259 /DNA_START=30 /DNA_END=1913 /DNA_ORIENTATION=-
MSSSPRLVQRHQVLVILLIILSSLVLIALWRNGPSYCPCSDQTMLYKPLGGGQSLTTLSLFGNTSLQPNQHQEQQEQQQQQPYCHSYLAESSIPRGGLGVYTGVAIPKGEPVQPVPDLCVYIFNARPPYTETSTHTWQDYRFGAQFEMPGPSSKQDPQVRPPRAACMGMVTLFNSMDNYDYATARPKAQKTFDTRSISTIHHHGGLTRQSHPGAGAISHYYGASSKALQDLHPGDELLLNDKSAWEEKATSSSSSSSKQKQPFPRRSMEWLHTNGWCLDHLTIQPSTDPSVGRGAFATRDFVEGTVLAPSPLQIFKNRTEFQTQRTFTNAEELLVNYCFQPQGSNLLVYPYGSSALGMINHAFDKTKINVKLQWARKHPFVNHLQWLNLPMEQFWHMYYPGSLVIEVVATRDIQKGEELFMDYGNEWERAWRTHVKNWKPIDHADDYVYPNDMMKRIADSGEPYRTISQLNGQQQKQQDAAYPPNLMTVCETSLRSDEREKSSTLEWNLSSRRSWPEYWQECHILESSTTKTTATTSKPSNATDSSSSPYWYKVRVIFRYSKKRNPKALCTASSDTHCIDYNVPHSAIALVDRPYASDQHLRNAFRHPMEFPAEMTPIQWLDSTTNL